PGGGPRWLQTARDGEKKPGRDTAAGRDVCRRRERWGKEAREGERGGARRLQTTRAAKGEKGRRLRRAGVDGKGPGEAPRRPAAGVGALGSTGGRSERPAMAADGAHSRRQRPGMDAAAARKG